MSNQAKPNSKVLILAALALCIAALALYGVFFMNAPAAVEGEKTITVEVVHGDGSSREFSLKTEEERLGPVLVAEGVVEDNQSAYGLYILTADGETVDEGNQEWWKITKGGEALSTGADGEPVADGDHFELVFTVGYDG